MLCDGGESRGPQVRRQRGGIAGLVVGIVHLDAPVAAARKQLLVVRPTHALDDVLVRLGLPDLVVGRQVPHFDDAVAAARGKPLERVGVLGHGIDAVDVAAAELGQEWLGEHAVHLCRIQGSRVLARALKGVQCWVQVASLALHRSARCLLLRRSA